MAETLAHHVEHCPEYSRLLQHCGYEPKRDLSIEDLYQITPIPTLFLKRHEHNSVPVDDMVLRYTTSGTSGKPVEVGMDRACLRLGASMLWRLVRRHGLLSARPTRHIILGYQPSKHNHMGAVQTAYNSTWMSLPICRTYALQDTGDDYQLNMDGVAEALQRGAQGRLPVRLSGFPAYMLRLLQVLRSRGERLYMPAHSMVMLGGGWKQFMSQRIDKPELYALVREFLGIEEANIREFFGVVEHQIPYFDCARHRFHVPVYSRVIIRDPHTLEPLPYGQPGLLNLLTPFLHSMPLLSIMTDDVAVLHPGRDCGCGIDAPWFEILGRAGMEGIVTCAATAEELL